MPKINQYFEELISIGASDLHLIQGEKPKFRLQGELITLENDKPLKGNDYVEVLKEFTPPELYQHFEQVGDLDFAHAMETGTRFRINFFRHFSGIGAIFRVVPSNIPSLDDIAAPEIFKTFSEMRSGLILVTGPTGSGKSTTLAAIIDHINKTTNKKIITIEEPLEFVHTQQRSIVIHREVGVHTSSFNHGLAAAMKSDANVILIGEMRDKETIELACVASEMGILVFGTLHTNSAAKTIDRIVDVFPHSKKNQIRSILASSLKGVISQQLLKTADSKSRIAAFEILLYSSALPPIIRQGQNSKLNAVIQTSRNEGMISMDDYLFNLVKDNKVTKEEALKKAFDKKRFL